MQSHRTGLVRFQSAGTVMGLVASFQVSGDGTTYTAGQTATITGKGTLTIASDGSYTFTPEANWNGSVPQVTYTVNTGSTSTLSGATVKASP